MPIHHVHSSTCHNLAGTFGCCNAVWMLLVRLYLHLIKSFQVLNNPLLHLLFKQCMVAMAR